MKIPIKKYVMDEALSWEERYRLLEKHHEEETSWMIGKIKRLELPPNERLPTMKSAEIDALIEEGVEFSVRKFYGLELRGLLGDIVRSIEIRPINEEKGEYRFNLVIVVRCVESGLPDREVIFEGPVTRTPGERENGLTPEQEILVAVLKHQMIHEVQESIRLDGIHIRKPTHNWLEKTRIDGI